jgi:hypothetical protein
VPRYKKDISYEHLSNENKFIVLGKLNYEITNVCSVENYSKIDVLKIYVVGNSSNIVFRVKVVHRHH